MHPVFRHAPRALLLLCAALFLALAFPAKGQDYPYRSAENPYYWKNRPPHEGYWQQDVRYRIEATLDDTAHVIRGERYELTYYNNSPDELTELYFHLYAQAFQPHSYYDKLWMGNGRQAKFGERYEAKGLGMRCKDVRVNGQPADTLLDNTVMRVNLAEPLAPGDSLTVTMRFDFFFGQGGEMRRRAKMYEQWGQKHFNACHWYPILCVYDRKFGWHVEQHLDKEFYADFGEFEIDLTLPQEYIVEATGTLENRAEVLPPELRRKLDLSNFADKPLGETPSEIVPRVPGKTKTWRYRAVNVHNVAFTASPSYRIGEVQVGEVRVATLVREPHAAKWQQTVGLLGYVVQFYSNTFGAYAYPKIVVADAEDGMEYPMLALCQGFFPGHLRVITHEVGHMWFYGMVANNEQYRAALDEGFTQFAEVEALNLLYGGESIQPETGNEYVDKRLDPYSNRYSLLYYPYLKTVRDGYDLPLNTRSDDFRGAIRQGGAYGLVYYKSGTMLHNLRYVLGDELFYGAMRDYFDRWKMAHPYMEDFRRSVIGYAKTDLNWFFDQWLTTTKRIDYSVEKAVRLSEGKYAVTFRRKGDMQMPIDFVVRLKGGRERAFHIPNTWFVKPTDAKVLPKWYGWGLLNEEYTAIIATEGEIENVEIDPALLMADVDRTDNVWRGAYRFEFDHRVNNAPSWRGYDNYVRPDLWYTAPGGLQVGAHFEGEYMELDRFYDATLLASTTLGQDVPGGFEEDVAWVSGHFGFRLRAFERHGRGIFVDGRVQQYGGIGLAKLGIEKEFRRQGMENPDFTTVRVQAKYMTNFLRSGQYYYPLREEDGLNDVFTGNSTDGTGLLGYWPERELNAALDLSVTRFFEENGWRGSLRGTARTPCVGSEYDFSFLETEALLRKQLGKLDFAGRFFGRWSFGGGAYPSESLLHLAGASPEDLQDDKYGRTAGVVPTAWTTYQYDLDPQTGYLSGTPQGVNHFQQGGGLNLRGYAGFYNARRVRNESRPVQADDPLVPSTLPVYMPYGTQGASASLELGFDRLLGVRRLTSFLGLETYLFADGGVLGYREPLFDDGVIHSNGFQADAGLGAVLTVKPGGKYLDMRPVRIRFDLPLYLSDEAADGESFAFRWVMGFGRTF